MQFKDPTCYWKEQEPGFAGIYSMITFAGRLTHNCEHKTEGAEDYVNRMKRLGHGRVFEFGTVYLTIFDTDPNYEELVDFYEHDSYSRVVQNVRFVGEFETASEFYITTNYRVLLKGESSTWTEAINTQYAKNRLNDLAYMSNDNIPSKYHERRHTIVWDYGTSRVTLDSFRTHITLSSLMMSTRYCKFSAPKYGDSLVFSRPYWLTNPEIKNDTNYLEYDVKMMYCKKKIAVDEWAYIEGLCDDERRYFGLTLGQFNDEDFKPWSAERARGLLGLDIASKMIQCGYEDDWREFFRQRTKENEGPHPDAIYVASQALRQLGENDFTKGKI